MTQDYSILIGGAAGQGSRKAGLTIAKLFSHYGYRIFIYDDYQSLIRGGHNFSQIRAAKQKVLSHREEIDFLLALNQDTIKRHKKYLAEKGVVIYNSDRITKVNLPQRAIGISVKKITEKAGGRAIMENTALIAGFAKIIGVDWPTLEKVLRKELNKFLRLNLKIARLSFNSLQTFTDIKIQKLAQTPLPLLTGNQAIALGAVKAGLDLYFAYPMTPASSILHYLVQHKKDFNLGVSQLENEIAVMNAAVGAAYSGARTMVGTSGGGLALMTEALSLSAQSEVPVVIVESQRAAPATGVPTYTAQSDLLFSLTAGHGDFLRFVIAPGDAEESFIWAGKILNLAWQYQTPAILLVDKEVSESTFNFEPKTINQVKYEKPLIWDRRGEYRRYQNTREGISPLAFPGQPRVISKVASYEHDEYGITVENKKEVQKMQDKRLRKFKQMKAAVEGLAAVKVYGRKNSDRAIVVWGSTKGPAKEAAEKLGIKMIQPIVLEPFPEKQMKNALKGVKKLALVETTATGQLAKVLNCYSIKVHKKVLKYNSRPFLPEEIIRKLTNF